MTRLINTLITAFILIIALIFVAYFHNILWIGLKILVGALLVIVPFDFIYQSVKETKAAIKYNK